MHAQTNDKGTLQKFNLAKGFSFPGLLLLFGVLILASAQASAGGASVFLEEMTSTEVASALHAGKTTIIVPVGGTEQNGPHMALGKHNTRVRAIAGRVAQQLGNALVAPVLAYVPEGNLSPPTEHMRFAGTISVPEAAFKGVLEGAARSFKQHGFIDIVLVGDHGGYQSALKTVAESLNREWAKTPVRAHFVPQYYRATTTTYVQALKGKGLTDEQIGTHAGSADTSLMLAVDPSMVRMDKLEAAGKGGASVGSYGDPRAATAALGQLGVDDMVAQTVSAVRNAVAARR